MSSSPIDPIDLEISDNGGVTRKTQVFKFNARLFTTKFVCELVANHSEFPEERVGDNVGMTAGGDLKLNVVVCGGETRECGGKKKSPVVVCKFALMDANAGLLLAATNSGVSNKLHGKKVPPGTTLTITNCSLIWHETNSFCEKKLLLPIDDFSFESPPKGTKGDSHWEEALECSGPFAHDWDECRADGAAVRHVFDAGLISCLKLDGFNPGEHACESEGLWALDDAKEINRTGSFIKNKTDRDHCVRALRKRIHNFDCNKTRDDRDNNRDNNDENSPNACGKKKWVGVCECMTRFGLLDCATKIKTLESINKDCLFEDTVDRLHGNVVADSWVNLKSRHKRWSLCYCHFVNVLHGAAVARRLGGPRVKLPSCLVGCIRSHHPILAGEDQTYCVGCIPTAEI